MKSFKIKLLLSVVILTLSLLVMTITVYATNDDMKIVKLADKNYGIYIEYDETSTSKNFINYEFEFAFSNTNSENGLTYLSAGKDTANAIYGAYITSDLYDQYFLTSPTYIWAKTKDSGNANILAGVEIDLSSAIDISNLVLEDVNKIAKTINIKIEQDDEVTYEDSNGVTQTVQREKITILDSGEFYYQVEKIPSSDEYNRLYELASNISKYNIYKKLTHLSELNEFVGLFNSLYGTLDNSISSEDASWILAEDGVIPQPEGTKNEEQYEYIVWIRNKDGSTHDVQFMTAWEIPDKGYVPSLLVTGDDNTLLIAFACLLVAIIIVSVIIRNTRIEKTDMTKGKKHE